MAEAVITFRHTTLTSGCDVIGGTPISPIRRSNDNDRLDLTKLLNKADRNLSREIGGFFFNTIDGVFVVGFLTPRDASDPGVRKSEYFYDVFECRQISVIEEMDLVSLRNGLEKRSVSKPDAEFQSEFDHEVTHEWIERPEESPHSLETVARIWDQYRRDDSSQVAKLDELSYFTSVVRGSLTELSFVDTSEEPSELYFSFRNGDPSSFETERQSYLLKFLKTVRPERGGQIQFDDLPSLSTERQRRRESIMEQQVNDLRDEVDYTEAVKEVWDEVFEREIVPLIDEHIEEFGELHRSRLDSSEPTETFNGMLDGLLGSTEQPSMEARMENVSQDIVNQMMSTTGPNGPLINQIEAEINRQVASMTGLSDERIAELRSLETPCDFDEDGQQ